MKIVDGNLYLGLISKEGDMTRECSECSMRLLGGYTIQNDYLCRACFEKTQSRQSRNQWGFKAEARVLEMICRDKVRRK